MAEDGRALMAVIKAFAVRKQLKKTVNYITDSEKTDSDLAKKIDYALNPAKTATNAEQFLYESVINLPDVATAYERMQATKERFGKTGGVLGYHIIQSFKPGEITADQCHELGRKLASEMFGAGYEIVIGTHLNKEHLHNHIVANSVSFIDGKKLRFNKQSYRELQEMSDQLCRKYGLSVIESKAHGKSYKEWLNEKEGKPTVRGQIRADIDLAIKESFNYGIFIANLEKRGYLIKDNPSRTYTALKPPFGARFIRLNSLGEEYTKEKIIGRLSQQKNWQKKTEPERTKYYSRKLPQKRRKITGLQAMYLRYVYLLKLNKKPKAKLSRYLWEDLCKFEKYKKEYLYLKAQNITTKEELSERITVLNYEVEKLKTLRKPLYEQKRRCVNIEQKNEIELKLNELNSNLKELRKELRLCNDIAENTAKIKVNLAAQRQENEIKRDINKEKQTKGDEANEPGERRG